MSKDSQTSETQQRGKSVERIDGSAPATISVTSGIRTKTGRVPFNEGLASLVMSFGPRPFELLYVVLLATGVNLVTGMLDGTDHSWIKIISAWSLTSSGILFFVCLTCIQGCYEAALDQQRIQIELKRKDPDLTVASVTVLAADNLTSNSKKQRITFATLFLGMILLVLALLMPLLGLLEKAYQSKVVEIPVVTPLR
jgi:hypothetical protein